MLSANEARALMGLPTGAKQEKATPAKGFRKRVKKEMETPENIIQANIITRLVNHGWLTVRVNGGGFKDRNGNRFNAYLVAVINAYAGFPDVMAFHRTGRFLLIEVKKPSGELSAYQEKFHAFAKQMGIPVHVLRDPSEVEELIKP